MAYIGELKMSVDRQILADATHYRIKADKLAKINESLLAACKEAKETIESDNKIINKYRPTATFGPMDAIRSQTLVELQAAIAEAEKE